MIRRVRFTNLCLPRRFGKSYWGNLRNLPACASQRHRIAASSTGGSADGIGGMRFKFHVSPGFTLLEVMIAVAIIAIALMAVLGSQSQGLSLAGESRFNRTATLLAQGKMAEVEAVKDQRDLSSGSGDFGDEFPGYTWQLSVQDVLFEGVERLSDRLKQIDLEVSWGSDGLYQYRLRLYRFFP